MEYTEHEEQLIQEVETALVGSAVTRNVDQIHTEHMDTSNRVGVTDSSRKLVLLTAQEHFQENGLWLLFEDGHWDRLTRYLILSGDLFHVHPPIDGENPTYIATFLASERRHVFRPIQVR